MHGCLAKCKFASLIFKLTSEHDKWSIKIITFYHIFCSTEGNTITTFKKKHHHFHVMEEDGGDLLFSSVAHWKHSTATCQM